MIRSRCFDLIGWFTVFFFTAPKNEISPNSMHMMQQFNFYIFVLLIFFYSFWLLQPNKPIKDSHSAELKLFYLEEKWNIHQKPKQNRREYMNKRFLSVTRINLVWCETGYLASSFNRQFWSEEEQFKSPKKEEVLLGRELIYKRKKTLNRLRGVWSGGASIGPDVLKWTHTVTSGLWRLRRTVINTAANPIKKHIRNSVGQKVERESDSRSVAAFTPPLLGELGGALSCAKTISTVTAFERSSSHKKKKIPHPNQI